MMKQIIIVSLYDIYNSLKSLKLVVICGSSFKAYLLASRDFPLLFIYIERRPGPRDGPISGPLTHILVTSGHISLTSMGALDAVGLAIP